MGRGRLFPLPWGRARRRTERSRSGGVFVYNRSMPIKKIIPGQSIRSEKLGRARELRHVMTPAEKCLWHELRANQLGVHFRRQQIIAGYIVDFYCHNADLVIEVDGEIHKELQKQDEDRDKVLRGLGLRVLHIQNESILNNLPQVLKEISELLR
jgi:very-short-patch-repair endonuclease